LKVWYALAAVGVAAIAIAAGLADWAYSSMVEIDRQSREIGRAAEQVRYLGEFDAAIGYGGMIHDFKNVVLRGHPTGPARVTASIAEARRALSALEKSGLTAAELEAISQIRETVTAYESKLVVAVDGIARGARPGEIDPRVIVDDRDALAATSRGTGELIGAALDAGCTQIVLAVGGSASTDGGSGLLSALGARFINADGVEIADGGGALEGLDRVDLSRLDERLSSAAVILASDVDNPLLGPHGAAAVFGPQKGASARDVEQLDRGLAKLTAALAAVLGEAAEAAASLEGAGAAGGVGYAALAVLGAERQPGIDLVFGITGLAATIAGSDLVITGEGSLDEQSLGGKVPVGVARLAKNAGVSVVAVCGRTTLTRAQQSDAGFVRVLPLMELEPEPDMSMRDAARLLEEIGSTIVRERSVGR